MSHEPVDESRETGPTWRWIALGACALVVSVGGLAIGLWSESLDQRLADIRNTQQAQWRILGERASLVPRTAELEKRTDDQEIRLRELERRQWRNGWK